MATQWFHKPLSLPKPRAEIGGTLTAAKDNDQALLVQIEGKVVDALQLHAARFGLNYGNSVVA